MYQGARADAFRKGLNDAGFFEGQNVTVEYHWLEGQFDRLPSLMAHLVRRRVAIIATPADRVSDRGPNPPPPITQTYPPTPPRLAYKSTIKADPPS